MSRPRSGWTALAICLALTLVGTTAWATTNYVGGNDQGANWYSGTWSNLQVAFSAALAGDEVRISGDISRTPGETVVGDLELTNSGTAGSRIVISGGWDADFSIPPSALARSVLNGNNDGTANNQNRTLTLSGSNVTVRNVTLMGGDDQWARQTAGNYVTGGYCVFSHVTVSNNNQDASDEYRTRGGLRWEGDRGIIEYSQIVNNRGGTCGGLDLEDARYTVVANCEICRNWSSSYGCAGLVISRLSYVGDFPTVLFGSLVALNYHLGTAVINAFGDSSNGGLGFSGPNGQTLPGSCLVNCTIADNGRCIDVGLGEGGFTQGQYFQNSIQANNNGKSGLDNIIYAGHDEAPNGWCWTHNASEGNGRGWVGYLKTHIFNDMALGFGHNRNQNNWGPASTDSDPLSNSLSDPKLANAPKFRDGAIANGTTTKIYVADRTKYAVGDVVEINRDGVARTVTGVGLDGGGQYLTIDMALGASSATYTGAASTTFIENWGPGKTAGDLAVRQYAPASGSGCIEGGGAVDAGTYIYVDVNQNGLYDWGLDIIVKLNGYSPVSMNVPNPTYYDLVYTNDLAGNPRVVGNTIDQGAYESLAPVIDNDGGASNLTASTATLNGYLWSTGAFPAQVHAFWGTEDKGQTTAWPNSSNLGSRAIGSVSADVAGLSLLTTPYFYTFAASNSAGWGWPASSSCFFTNYPAHDYQWAVPSNGNWSVAGNWAGGSAPTNGGNANWILQFGGGYGDPAYFSTNDLGKPSFQLGQLWLSSVSPSVIPTMSGSNLQFSAPGGGIRQWAPGAFRIGNRVDLAADTRFWGDGAGTVTLASNITGTGSVTKEGPWTMVWQGSNTFGGNITVNGSGGVLRADSPYALGTNSVTVSNGTLSVNVASPFVFSNSLCRTALVTGSGSAWTGAGALTVGTNAQAIVQSGALLSCTTLTIANRGSVGAGLIVTNGGRVSTTAGYVGNGTSSNTAQVASGGSLWDTGGGALVVGSGAATGNVLTADGLGVAGGAVVMPGGGVSVGAGAGASGNMLIVTNGGWMFARGASYVGVNAASNTAVVAGGSSLWNMGGANLSVGYEAATGNVVQIDGLGVAGGAMLTNVSRIYVANAPSGGSRATGNMLVVTNGGRVYATTAPNYDVLVGYNSAYGNKLLVAKDGYLEAGATAGGGLTIGAYNNAWPTNNELCVDGGGVWSGAVVNVTGPIGIGYGPQNNLTVTNGGYVAFGRGGAGNGFGGGTNTVVVSSNSVLRVRAGDNFSISGAGHVLRVQNGGLLSSLPGMYFGAGNGSQNQMIVESGGVVSNTSFLYLAYNNTSDTASYNVLTVTNGSRLYVVGLIVAAGGASNRLTVADNSLLDLGGGGLSIGYTGDSGAYNSTGNVVRIDGLGVAGGAVITNGASVQLGGNNSAYHGNGNRWEIVNGGRAYHRLSNLSLTICPRAVNTTILVSGTNSLLSGVNISGTSVNILTIAGTNDVMQVDSNATVSLSNLGTSAMKLDGYGNSLVVTNRGQFLASGLPLTIGATAGAASNVVAVTGSGSLLDMGGGQTLAIGVANTTGNALRIDQGGTADNIGMLTMTANNIMDLLGGTLGVANFLYTNGPVFQVGDGAQAATLKALGGTLVFTNGLLVPSNATLKGTGLVSGGPPGVIITNGATFTPGHSGVSGALTTSNLNWYGGGAYLCDITDLQSAPGVGWDLINVSTQLALTGAGANFVVRMNSMGTNAANFSPTADYNLRILSCGNVTNLDAGQFTIDTNSFQTAQPAAGVWGITNANNSLYLVYRAAPTYTPSNVWVHPNSGGWNTAANWTNNSVPASGPATVLEFGGASGEAAYYSTNDIANPFQLEKILLTSTNTSATNLIMGVNRVQFATAAGGIEQLGTGAFIISNGVDLAANTRFWGPGFGTVTLASNITGTGSVRKEGSWTLVWKGSNTFGGSIVLDSADGILRLDHAYGLGTNSVVVSNGTLFASVATTFSNSVYRSALVTGSGAVWTNSAASALTIGTNAQVTVQNGGTLACNGLTVADRGSVPNSLTITNGGRVVTFTTASYIGNGASNNTALVTGTNSLWNLGGANLSIGTAGTVSNGLTITGGAVVTNSAYFSVGMANGAVGNWAIVRNGGQLFLNADRFGIGADNSDNSGTNNYVLITGAGTRVVRVAGANVCVGHGANNGQPSGNRLIVDDGAVLDFSGGGSIAVGSGPAVGNSMVITNRGQVYEFEGALIGGTSGATGKGALSNSVVVTGAGSLWRIGQGAGRSLRIGEGAGASNNWLIVQDGGVVSNFNGGAGVSYQFHLGNNSSGNSVTLTNGGKLVLVGAASYPANIGTYGWGSNNVLTVSGANSLWDAGSETVFLGQYTGSYNRIIVRDAGVATNINILTIGDRDLAQGNNLIVNGGRLYATTIAFSNSLANSLTLTGAAEVTATNLFTTNLSSTIAFSGGVLTVKNATVSNNAAFVVGDGSQSATLKMLGGGTNTFWNGLAISTNATLTGAGTIQGATTVYGTNSPGWQGIGAITNIGTFTLMNNAISNFEIATNTTAGTGWDLLYVTNGVASLGGTLKVYLTGGFTPATGDSYLIITNTQPSGVTGSFTNVPGGRVNVYTNVGGFAMATFHVTQGAQNVIMDNFILRPPYPTVFVIR